MKRLCIFTLYDEKGASSRYRIMIYKNKLDEHFDVNMFHFWSNNYITRYTFNKKKYVLRIIFEYIKNVIKRLWQLYFIAPKSDVIFFQKAVIPGLRHTFLNHLVKKKKHIIFDVDDAIYLNSRDNSDAISAQASVIICGNAELESHYKKVNHNCIILPTIEDTRKFSSYWSDTYGDKIIGWIGSSVTLKNLDLVVDAVNIVVGRHPEVKFHIISNTAGDYIKRINGAVFIEWRLDTYLSEMSKFTVGIMPLRDIQFNRGKCGFKLIQCLSMKKPVVATEMGVNKDIVGNSGLMAETTEEWVDALETLLFERTIYDNCVRNINNEFFAKYNFDLVAEKMIYAMEQKYE